MIVTSYDPATGWFIFTHTEAGNVYFKDDQKFELGKSYWGGRAAALGKESLSFAKSATSCRTFGEGQTKTITAHAPEV